MGAVQSLLACCHAPTTGTKPVVRRTDPGRHKPIAEISVSELTRNIRSANELSDPHTLQVKGLDLDVKNNAKAHRTAEYDITDASVYDDREFLVVRRGQAFNVNVTFNKPFDPKNDELRIVFEFGKRPIPNRGTHVEIILSDEDSANEWGAWIESSKDNVTSLQIMTSPKIAVGKWKLSVDVVKRDQTSVTVYRHAHKDPIYILFNPWCKEDSVYLRDDDGTKLAEYILNETGNIYSGSYRKIASKPWVFGQFSGDVLDCALYLLETSRLRDHARGNPVIIARKLSAMINNDDENGVLAGKWSGDFSLGTPPLDWTGSVAILDKYYTTKEPVLYGQCWVFAGVLTTVCRALGIPARCVTNFSSAHDTDGSITIDKHYNADGSPLEEYNEDSVWNFHVWNDVWMARPDLPVGYGGWQAIDATPQETSQGVYCMGPVSVQAIREGRVNLPYDGQFAFAEVNADRLFWVLGEDGSMEKRFVLKNRIGLKLSTNPVSEDSPADKDSEREDEERAAVREANLHSTRAGMYETTAQDVAFDVTTNVDTFMGDDITVEIHLTNKSNHIRTSNGTLVLGSAYYTGVFYKELLNEKLKDIVLGPLEEKKLEFLVKAEDYLGSLVDHCLITISCVCVVKETRQHFVGRDELRLRKPHLTVKAPASAKVGEKFNVEVTFVNPLKLTLTNCELRAEGPGLQKPAIYKQSNVNANAEFKGTFDMTPVKAGKRAIVVYFNSRQISAVTASHSITVE
ncbi:TGMH-like protein [Mya arenaria]|uniref:TGMH-like protein n=1 Tax=Mya arenaria TaxID=6604 RepID=A0ABY7EYS8_MYAAR|nr:TGMH-like protein [Mya arenaria]